MNRYRCNNGCKYQMSSEWVCRHPNAIGCDGDGVGLTEYEKEHVKRMGCASHSDFQTDQNKILDVLDESLICAVEDIQDSPDGTLTERERGEIIGLLDTRVRIKDLRCK